MKRKIFSAVAVVAVLMTFITTVYAAVITYSNTETEHIARLPGRTLDGVRYTGVGGIAIGRKKNSMFVMKAEEKADSGSNNLTEQSALLYDFPDISNPTERHYYRLRHAGHANAMAIDATNIYVCGWTTNIISGNQQSNEYNNWILMIPREMFATLRKGSDGAFIHKYNSDNPDEPGYSVLYPKVKTVSDDGTVKYSDYERIINTISLYKGNYQFIIGIGRLSKVKGDDNFMSGLGDDMAFTTAKLEQVNGKTYFVVSESPKDIFVVKNNVANKDAVNQDICYAQGHGLFIPKWYGGVRNAENKYFNTTKTVIMWANIDGSHGSKVINGVSYRYYEPNKIVIDKSKEKGSDGKLLFDKFEPESIAFTKDENGYDGELLFSCNVKKGDSEQTYGDSVYKLTHDGGKNFSLN